MRSLVGSIEVCLKGYLQVKPTKDGVLREVIEPYTCRTNKVQLEHAAGNVGVSSCEIDGVVVVIDLGVRPLLAIIMLQVSG